MIEKPLKRFDKIINKATHDLNRGLLALLFLVCGLFAKPEIRVSYSAVSPQMYFIENDLSSDWKLFDNPYHWRTMVDYSQDFGHGLEVESLVEYGSTNNHFEHPFRIHSAVGKFHNNNHKLKFGRFTHWSSLLKKRIDGAKYQNHSKFGDISLLGGFVPSHIEDAEKETILGIFWGKPNFPKLGFWSTNTNYSGFSWNKTLFKKLRIATIFAWNLTENTINNARFLASYKLGNHRVQLQFRQFQIDPNFYSWVKKTITTDPLLSVGIHSRFSNILLSHRFGYRFTYETNWFYQTTLRYGLIQLSANVQNAQSRTNMGGNIALSDKIGDLSFGTSIGYNQLSYLDLEPNSSLGLYYWAEYRIHNKTAVKFFTRAAKNPYYSQFITGGLNVNYAF